MELESKAMSSADSGAETYEVKQAFDQFMQAFTLFKQENDQRLGALERRGGDVLAEEKVERINTALTEQKKSLDRLMLAAARPALGGEHKAGEDLHGAEKKAAFERYARKGDAGLDPTKYGLYCYDAWPEIPAVAAVEEVRDADGNIITPAVRAVDAVPAGNRYGVRPDELAYFLLAVIEQRLTALEAK